MCNSPLVSVGMPVFNCEETIGEAIASILGQTLQNWELIIIDDGSSDETLRVSRRFSDPRIRVIEGGSNKYLPTRLNEAIRIARGKYFARMDGDDVSYSDRLEKQVDYLEKHKEVDLLGGSILIFREGGDVVGFRRAQETHANICGRPWRPSRLPHVTWMGKRDWFIRNPYREDTSHAQDRELLTRTRRDSRFAAIPDILVGVYDPGLSLAKQIPAHRQFLRALLREGVRQRDIGMVAFGVPIELAKFAIDALAIGTGLGHKVPRYRIPPVTEEVALNWDRLRSKTSCLAAQCCAVRSV